MTQALDLASAPLDTPLTLVSVDGVAAHRQRLSTLGLREGASFRLLTRTIGGGRIALVAGSRIALGADLVRQLRAKVA
jgi:Fe2+ transport system protein FeoA